MLWENLLIDLCRIHNHWRVWQPCEGNLICPLPPWLFLCRPLLPYRGIVFELLIVFNSFLVRWSFILCLLTKSVTLWLTECFDSPLAFIWKMSSSSADIKSTSLESVVSKCASFFSPWIWTFYIIFNDMLCIQTRAVHSLSVVLIISLFRWSTLIFSEVGIPNLRCDCFLTWWQVLCG